VPLMLVPYALHNQVFRARTSSWELFSQPGYEKPFSPAYVPDNLGHALNYFFDFSDRQPNSLALSFLGFLAIPFLLFWLMRVAREASRRPPAHLAMAIFATGFIAHTALMMGYFWGRFDDPVITRLSLPAQLFLVLGVVCAGADMPNQKWVWRGLGCAALVGLFGQSLPSMSRHQYSLAYYYGAEMQWRRDFIAAHPERNYLFIDNSSIIWLTHQVSATSMRQAIDHKENIVFNLRNRSFGAVYVFQRLDVDPDTGRLTPQRDDVLGPDYQLETYWERRFTPLTVSRISRVVSVREGPTARPDPAPPPLDSLPPAERERIRQQYLENFIKRLP
jgi:hypothetical protein